MNATAELNEILDAMHGLDDPDDAGLVADDMGADRLLRRIAAIEAEQQAREQAAAEQIECISEWVVRHRERAGEQTARIRGTLESYLRERNARDPRLKTLDLPSGVLALRKVPPKWHYPEDEHALRAALDYARGRGLVRVTAKADAGAAAAALLATAAGVAGITVDEALDKPGIKRACRVIHGQVVDTETGEVVPGVTVEDSLPPEFYARITR